MKDDVLDVLLVSSGENDVGNLEDWPNDGETLL